MSKSVTLVFPGGGVGPPARIDSAKVWYVVPGVPPGAERCVGFTQDEVSTVVSTDGAVVCVLGYYVMVADLLIPEPVIQRGERDGG